MASLKKICAWELLGANVLKNLWLASRAGKILRCDWLPEQARWSYLARSGLPRRPARKISGKPYNKSFIDQVRSVKMAGYCPRSLSASLFMNLDSVSVHKHAKKEHGQYPAILTSHLANNSCILIRPTYNKKQRKELPYNETS